MDRLWSVATAEKLLKCLIIDCVPAFLLLLLARHNHAARTGQSASGLHRWDQNVRPSDDSRPCDKGPRPSGRSRRRLNVALMSCSVVACCVLARVVAHACRDGQLGGPVAQVGFASQTGIGPVSGQDCCPMPANTAPIACASAFKRCRTFGVSLLGRSRTRCAASCEIPRRVHRRGSAGSHGYARAAKNLLAFLPSLTRKCCAVLPSEHCWARATRRAISHRCLSVFASSCASTGTDCHGTTSHGSVTGGWHP
jgi:hypothetical protein